MSFNLSSDEEDEEQLEELWKKVANESTHRDSDDEGSKQDDDGFFFDMAMTTPVARLPTGFGFGDDNDDDSDEEDSVNWEDAGKNDPTNDDDDEEMGDDGDKKLPADTAARPLQAVTIDLGKKPAAKDKDEDEEKNKKKKIRTRRSYSLTSLPRQTQSLLINLHMSHWLALSSHVVFNSSQCSTELTLAVAYSLLPASWTDNNSSASTMLEESGGYNVPSMSDLQNFCSWYFDLVHKAEERRSETLQANMAAGAPRQPGRRRRRSHHHYKRKRMETTSSSSQYTVCSPSRLLKYCSYLSATLDDNPQLLLQSSGEEEGEGEEWSSSDRVNLFIAMARSLGWRARYTASIDPIKTNLDVDHPILLGAMTSVFQAVSSWSQAHPNGKKGDVGGSQPRKRPKKSTKKTGKGIVDLTQTEAMVRGGGMPPAMGTGQGLVGWVEVLCQTESGGAKSTRRNKKQQSNASISDTRLKWVPVDPEIQAIDQPHRVEGILFEQQLRQQSAAMIDENSPTTKRKASRGMSKKRRPVAYVVAAEHSGDNQRLRVTDVTPRYAASMVESLKLRGVPAKNQAKVLSSLKSCWWTKAVLALNKSTKPDKGAEKSGVSTPKGSAKGKKPPTPPSSGKSSQEAIDIDESEDEASEEEEPVEEDGADSFEKEELTKSAANETIPTSKERFKNHPLYVIPSVLKKVEVLAPDAKKRVCGFFKGEMVYKRSDVSEALVEKKWLYQGRKVKKSELVKPVKRVKARAKSSKGGGSFKALGSYGVGKENDGSEEHQKKQLELAEKPLDDGMQDLYAIWQTKPWSPPRVGPNDKIPVNEYKNIELELINPGLAHIDVPKIAPVAKQLGIPYAPCLLGFEGHRGNRTPTIRGIVVHEHNAQLLREASVEVVSKSIEDENESRRRAILAKWKRLLVGVLTKDRLDREYG